MHRIIDFRLRPPAHGFLTHRLYSQPDRSRRITERLGLSVPPSAIARDMDLLVREMDAAGVRIGVVAARRSAPDYGTIPTEDVLAIVRERPGRFLALTSVGPDFEAPSIEAVADAAGRRHEQVLAKVLWENSARLLGVTE